MGKREKNQPWQVAVKGIIITLLLYFGMQVLLTFCVLKEFIPESRCLPVLSASALLASMLGGLYSGHRLQWNRWLTALTNAAAAALVLASVGAFRENGVVWKGSGGVLLLSILTGGILAGLFGGKRSRGKRKRRPR